MSQQALNLATKPAQNNFLPLNSSWLEMPDRELTPEYQAKLLNEIKLGARCSRAMLECNMSDAEAFGVPRAKFWEWVAGDWQPEASV